MATAPHPRTSADTLPNASDFLTLYAFERPGPALPVDAFIAELKAIVRAHTIDPGLAHALKYGGVDTDGVRRWIKDYYWFIRHDASATAQMVARCRRRGLFIALSPLVNRKTGFQQVTTPALDLFVRFAEAFGLTREDLEAHYACPETLQATYTRLHFQFSTFEEAYVVNALAAEGPLCDVLRDERPWLCQRGIAEYMKRAWNLTDEAVAYWRAYEDFRGFVIEPVWDIVREFATDAAQQDVLRTTLRDWLAIYQNARQAWSALAAGRYERPALAWPPADLGIDTGPMQSYEALEEELGQFCLRLARPKETAFGLLLSGRASLDAARELVKDFIHMDATRNIAGQLTRLPDGRARRAVAQAFATESGGYLTRNHMEIWADFCEQALAISREDLFAWTPPTETVAMKYVTAWFLVHGEPAEAIAAFHLGPPTRVKKEMGKAALGLGQGGVAGEGLIDAPMHDHPLVAAFRRLGIDPDIAGYFFRLHQEIEPFEQDEGWAYVPTVLTSPRERQAFKRAYITKLHAESTKDQALLRRMKRLSGLAG